jgi:undecaprenyl-diphosphatase
MQDFALLHALLLGIVEGLTEFLPVSSTGHLILAADLLGFQGERAKVFEIVIQTGAMLAIVVEYRARFGQALMGVFTDRSAQRFWLHLALAVLPAALLGLAFGSMIKAHLFSPVPVAIAFMAGAFVILWVERKPRLARVEDVDAMTWTDALKVGVAQAFALIPGTSRSGATIIGGMLFGLSRRVATEFSFFLAVPTLVAAGAYDLYKNWGLLSAVDLPVFGVGFVSAFVSAFLCVRWILRYIALHDFRPFAWYRIAFGLVVLGTAHSGWVNWTVR